MDDAPAAEIQEAITAMTELVTDLKRERDAARTALTAERVLADRLAVAVSRMHPRSGHTGGWRAGCWACEATAAYDATREDPDGR